MRLIALIPARAGSKRVPGKNGRLLGGKPLYEWTIQCAKDAGVFDRIYFSSDHPAWAEDVHAKGCEVLPRHASHATDQANDLCWILDLMVRANERADAFAILRPTSPFRDPADLVAAWEMLQANAADIVDPTVDSIRGVRPVSEHPLKMWASIDYLRGLPAMRPFIGSGRWSDPEWPWSRPTQQLQAEMPVYVQTASLEIAWTKRTIAHPKDGPSISGREVMPYVFDADDWSCFDINTERDWALAELAIEKGWVKLP